MRSRQMGSQGNAIREEEEEEQEQRHPKITMMIQEQQQEDEEQEEPLMNLTRQGSSLYSLTLDEVQNQLGDLGKPLGSMNLDELLKSVWTADPGPVCQPGAATAPAGPRTSLPRQGSLNLFADLTKKTVDEVWRDIQQKKTTTTSSTEQERKAQERHPTLGEMTLEDFLVKAGVVSKSAQKGGSSSSGLTDPAAIQWMPYQMPPQPVPAQQPVAPRGHHQHHHHQMAVYMPPGHVVGPDEVAGGYEGQMMMSPSALMGTLSDTQATMPMPARKRVASEDVVEKTVERRQKRMIKNRESAARSRARRQAYTHELENKVSRLEEENERLRRQKEIEKILPCIPSPEPKNQLRRTSSAPL